MARSTIVAAEGRAGVITAIYPGKHVAIDPKRHPSRWRTLIAVGLAVLLTVLALVALLPSWSMAVLPLVLASSELSPALALFAALWLLVARRLLAAQPGPRLVVTWLL